MRDTLERVRGWVQRGAAGVLLAWCLLAAVSALRDARAHEPDPIADLDEEFRSFAWALPARGVIGYLDRHEDAGSEEAVRMWYAAQYALAPRVIEGRVGPELLIVARGAARPGEDPRLAGYFEVWSTPGGHRLFRRLVR